MIDVSILFDGIRVAAGEVAKAGDGVRDRSHPDW
jgi:hypothetical protein